MPSCDYSAPWYHGSPEKLHRLRPGSWVTQFKELAKAFAHQPSLISFSDDQTVKHDGQVPAYLYQVDACIGPADVLYLRDTAQTHWQTQRELPVTFVSELPLDDPPQLSPAEIAAMRRQIPAGSTGFIGEKDKE